MNRLYYLLPLALILINIHVYQAQNLVSDPGLENYILPFCGIMEPQDFDLIMLDWYNPSEASPAMFFTNNEMDCYNHQPTNQYPGPIGIKGSQTPKSGTAMAGLWVYTFEDFNQRQYIQTELSSPLEMAQGYVVSFYVSLADSMEFAIDKLGAYLSVDEISVTNDSLIQVTPQVLSNEMITDNTEWILISDTIVAEEAYNFITIGNFFSDNNTNTMPNPLASGAPGTYGSYYFIDDISVVPLEPVSINEIPVQDFKIYPTLVHDHLIVECIADCETSKVSIHNSIGQLLFSEPMNAPLISIDFSGWTRGSYFISVENKGRVFSEKIFKK